MVCKLCQERANTWIWADPKCGFPEGIFTPDNWNCATVGKIRRIADRLSYKPIPGVQYQNSESDQRYATIYVMDIDLFHNNTDGPPICLWIGWYKNRGGTEGMWLLYENQPPRQPTEEECLAIIDAYSKYFPE